ncbi:MAG: NAD(P)-binding domain-containing protein [Tepidisphaeraceae bacterium]
MKVSIIGVGKVGAALGIVLVARQLASEIVLVGRDPGKTKAEALDLAHAAALGRPIRVIAGDIAATAGSHVIVVCIGAPMTADQDRSAPPSPTTPRYARSCQRLRPPAPTPCLSWRQTRTTP